MDPFNIVAVCLAYFGLSVLIEPVDFTVKQRRQVR